MNKSLFSLFLLFLKLSTSAAESCLEILPNKKDYIVTSDLLRKTIECFEPLRKPKAYGAINRTNSPSFALRQNNTGYAIKLFGQKKMYIRQVNNKPSSLNAKVEFFDKSGKLINKISKEISGAKALQLGLKPNFNYALINITGQVSQTKLLIYAK